MQPIPKNPWSQRSGTISNVNLPCYHLGRGRVLGRRRCPIVRSRDRASACLVIVFDEPIDRLLESLFEWRKLELFVIVARLAHKSN
jgi:hypothetical protein